MAQSESNPFCSCVGAEFAVSDRVPINDVIPALSQLSPFEKQIVSNIMYSVAKVDGRIDAAEAAFKHIKLVNSDY